MVILCIEMANPDLMNNFAIHTFLQYASIIELGDGS